MPSWEVRGGERSVRVDAPNWMMAVGTALDGLGLGDVQLSGLICDIRRDGVVRIYDPGQDAAMLVRLAGVGAPAQAVAPTRRPMEPLTSELPGRDAFLVPDPDAIEAPEPPSLQAELDGGPERLPTLQAPKVAEEPVAVVAAGPAADWMFEAAFEEPSEEFNADDLAFVRSPTGPLAERAPAGLHETLFQAGMDIADAISARDAADAALDVLLKHIPAESAAVLYAGSGDGGLRFLSVRGPSAAAVRDLQIPFDQGIAGFAHRRGADLIVQDASADPRHLHDVDAQTGYRTRSLLVAAIRDGDGTVHGCIELLNPPRQFHGWHLDATRSVARTLGEYLGRQR